MVFNNLSVADDVEFIQEERVPQLRGDIAHIVDFRTVSNGTQKSEYSYNTIINTHTGNIIDQIWAGPCHWKLKFIRPATTRFSGARSEVPVKQRRKKIPPEMIDFCRLIEIDYSKKVIIKKRPCIDINK